MNKNPIPLLLLNELSSSSDDSEISSEDEYININKKINNINDLIELGKLYNPKNKYNIDLLKIYNILNPLNKLKNMIGLTNVKKTIVNQIIYFLNDFDDSNNMMHTVIQGPPGVGKTMLGKIIGEIYYGLGILKGQESKKRDRDFNNKNKFIFNIIKRSDLIGKYLGHTAIKTQKAIDKCSGGVMFIDEAYSLGNKEGRDSYSKECIDTINQNLTENKANFLCIIAGYKNALDKCFFAYNEGLRRRFTFIYTIDNYTAKELREIFILMINKNKWDYDKIPIKFFKKNYSCFKNSAGDMETLFLNCKIKHSRRVFGTESIKKKLTIEDINEGFKIFVDNRKEVKEDDSWKLLYI